MKKILLILAVFTAAAYSTAQDTVKYQSPYIAVQEITSKEFLELKQKAPPANDKQLNKITDFDAAQKALADRVLWWDAECNQCPEEQCVMGRCPLVMKFKNGEKESIPHPEFQGFQSYFPDEDILCIKGANAVDACYNLTTGEGENNPVYRRPSPSGLYRLTGYFTGDDSAQYFIEQKKPEGYETVFDLSTESAASVYDANFLENFLWLTDNEFIFNTPASGGAVPRYFKVKIKTTPAPAAAKEPVK